MNPARPATVTTIVVFLALVGSARADRTVDPAMHHVRAGAGREWDEFPERAEGGAPAARFDAAPADL